MAAAAALETHRLVVAAGKRDGKRQPRPDALAGGKDGMGEGLRQQAAAHAGRSTRASGRLKRVLDALAKDPRQPCRFPPCQRYCGLACM